MSQEPSRSFGQALLSAWQAELKATNHPNFKQQLSHGEAELLPRFTAHYPQLKAFQQLKALRRRMRRSLQRQWKRSLAGLALLLALGQAPALAALSIYNCLKFCFILVFLLEFRLELFFFSRGNTLLRTECRPQNW
jgi:hypothetical protein